MSGVMSRGFNTDLLPYKTERHSTTRTGLHKEYDNKRNSQQKNNIFFSPHPHVFISLLIKINLNRLALLTTQQISAVRLPLSRHCHGKMICVM